MYLVAAVRFDARFGFQVWHQNLSEILTLRPIERLMDSVFHKTEMKIWAGQKFLAAHVVLPKGQHLQS